MANQDLFWLCDENTPQPTGGPLGRLFERLFPPATWAELVAGMALVGISLLGGWWVLRYRADALALERDAVVFEGTVSRLWLTYGKVSHYHVAYQSPAGPEASAPLLQGRADLSKEHFDRLAEGKPVAVQVCRSNPANHLLVGARPGLGADPADMAAACIILVLLLMAGMVNLWWWTCSRSRSCHHG
jgi:hypothetical protein